MFEEQFEQLTNRDKEIFAHTVNALLLKSFILRESYDKQNRMMKTNPDYSFLEKNIDLVREYLGYSGWVIEKDSQLGIIMIQNEYQENRIRLDFMTSLMIYALRYAYEVQREQNPMLQEVYFSSTSLIQLMLDKSLVTAEKRPSATVSVFWKITTLSLVFPGNIVIVIYNFIFYLQFYILSIMIVSMRFSIPFRIKKRLSKGEIEHEIIEKITFN